MADKITVESPDLLKLQRTFEALEYKDQRNIIVSAFRKATKPTIAEAKGHIHNVTRNLFKSVGLLVVKNEVAVIVAARKKNGFKGWHGHLVEEGTRSRHYYTKKGKEHKTGRMDSSKSYSFWLKRAVDSTSEKVRDTVGDEWYASIQRFHVKYGLR
jgi:hypothetical protein